MKKQDIAPWFVYHSGLNHANPNILYLLKIIKNVKKKFFTYLILDRLTLCAQASCFSIFYPP